MKKCRNHILICISKTHTGTSLTMQISPQLKKKSAYSPKQSVGLVNEEEISPEQESCQLKQWKGLKK